MSELRFLSPDTARAANGFEPVMRSPLERALAHAESAGLEDLSLSTGKLEVRGNVGALDIDAEVIRITPQRALVLCDSSRVAEVREHLRRGALVIDLTAAIAGLRLDRPDAETVMRRVTDLDLDELPAVGALSHVQAYAIRDGEHAFRLFFAQEYGHFVTEVVLDAIAGLEATAGAR